MNFGKHTVFDQFQTPKSLLFGSIPEVQDVGIFKASRMDFMTSIYEPYL